jgi:hypothetical protein
MVRQRAPRNRRRTMRLGAWHRLSVHPSKEVDDDCQQGTGCLKASWHRGRHRQVCRPSCFRIPASAWNLSRVPPCVTIGYRVPPRPEGGTPWTRFLFSHHAKSLSQDPHPSRSAAVFLPGVVPSPRCTPGTSSSRRLVRKKTADASRLVGWGGGEADPKL